MMRRFIVTMICTALTVIGGAAALAAAQSPGGGASTGTATAGPGQTITPGPTTEPAGQPHGTAAQQTHPKLVPRTATRASKVTLWFTLADQPGHQGVIANAYRVQIDRPHGARTACQAPAPALIDTGTQGTVDHVPLARPPHGWCVGTYTITVYLQRGPYCRKPDPGQPPTPCPEFASQELGVGHTQLIVRAPAHR